MDSSETGSYPSSWKKAPFIKNSFLRWLLIVGGAIYLAAALGTMNIDLERIKEGLPRAQRFLDSFFPPNFADNRGVVWEGLAESIWMAIISTVAGIALSIPIGLGAARNLAPAWVYLFCRGIIAASRTFPEIILAIFAVKLFGFGPFAGFIALAKSSYTLGFNGKMLIHPTQIELANNIYTPSKKELSQARAMLKAIEKSSKNGKGAIAFNGKLLDIVTIKQARNIVELNNKILEKKND